MMILHICDNTTVLSVMKIVKTVINIIKIAVPIILIISLMITYMRAVKEDDELAKYNKVAISKIIAALLIFFIPTFINIIADIASADKSYLNCIKNATDEGIANAYRNTARTYINRVKSTLTTSDYNIAVSYVNGIKDKDVKQDLLDELNSLKEYVELKEKISSGNYDYNDILNKINKIDDENVKNTLYESINKKPGQKTLNVESGLHKDKYDGIDYYEIIPPHPTTNMPLIVFLHGDGENGNFTNTVNLPITTYIKENNAYDEEEFIFLAPHRPTSDYATEYNITKTKGVIDYIVNKYEIDKDRIIIVGMSGGTILTWGMVNKYPDYFAATVPMSCPPVNCNANNFKTTPVYSISGDDDQEKKYEVQQKAFVNQINNVGGTAKHVTYPGYTHTTIQSKFKDKELFKWMLSHKKKR